jgi:hypothetical protein
LPAFSKSNSSHIEQTVTKNNSECLLVSDTICCMNLRKDFRLKSKRWKSSRTEIPWLIILTGRKRTTIWKKIVRQINPEIK